MSLLVKPNVSPDRLNNILVGYKEMKVLFTAIELDVFSVFSDDVSSCEAATSLNLNQRNMEYFLNALVAMDLLIKKNGKYKNTELSEIYLVKGSDLYMGDYFLFRESFTGLGDIENSLRDGPDLIVLKENKGRDVFDFARLAELSVNEQRIGRAETVSEIITGIFNSRKFDKMIDLGGGSGVIALAVAEKNPNTECIVFDTADVVEAAEKTIRRFGGSGKVKTCSGDYVSDDFGGGYDLVLAVASIQFAKGHFKLVLNKIYNSLNKNGLFISVCGATFNEKTKPKELIIGWLGSHLLGLGVLPERGELCREIKRAGFEFIDLQDLPSGMEVFRKR